MYIRIVHQRYTYTYNGVHADNANAAHTLATSASSV